MSRPQPGAAAPRALARRASGSYAKTLASLAADHRLAFRRLSAASFLEVISSLPQRGRGSQAICSKMERMTPACKAPS